MGALILQGDGRSPLVLENSLARLWKWQSSPAHRIVERVVRIVQCSQKLVPFISMRLEPGGSDAYRRLAIHGRAQCDIAARFDWRSLDWGTGSGVKV